MTSQKMEKLVLPALRGVMGDWVYYSCLMDTTQLAARVRYATEVHKSESLSKMIQRQLTTSRSKQISDYLRNQPERFFNSLVVATYGGEPNWYPLSDLKSRSTNQDLAGLNEETVGSVGFLTLHGSEELFALDGQHRLAGIKKAVKDGVSPDKVDDISVILVAHKETAKGLERTRRLFTTLNKTARPVSKGDIIALDEDDVMALAVRWLIEETGLFAGERLAYVASNNMPTTNTKSLTTIGNLYDMLVILFTAANTDLKKSKADLQRIRPADAELRQYFKLAETLITAMRDNFADLKAFFSAKDTEAEVKKNRGSHGGSVLYRPLGLEMLVQVVSVLSKDSSIPDAVAQAAKLPTALTDRPFLQLMWDPSNRTIVNSHKVTLRETLLYMLGKSKLSESKVLERYRKAIGDETAALPATVK